MANKPPDVSSLYQVHFWSGDSAVGSFPSAPTPGVVTAGTRAQIEGVACVS